MTGVELMEKIKDADYLSEEDKQKWLEMMPRMSVERLSDLAQMVLWAEEQKLKLKREQDLVMHTIAGAFEVINKNAVRKAKKEVQKLREKRQKGKDSAQQENLLKELGNG